MGSSERQVLHLRKNYDAFLLPFLELFIVQLTRDTIPCGQSCNKFKFTEDHATYFTAPLQMYRLGKPSRKKVLDDSSGNDYFSPLLNYQRKEKPSKNSSHQFFTILVIPLLSKYGQGTVELRPRMNQE